jgi:S1-C subfamily serine protease
MSDRQEKVLAEAFGVDKLGQALTQTAPLPVTLVHGSASSLIRATVMILAYQAEQLRWSGSGSIVTADGMILTNAHVAYPIAPGLAVLYVSFAQALEGAPDKLVVAVNEAEDRPPVPRFRAELRKVDGYLDVAVIQITATADGAPIDPTTLGLQVVPLGDSDQIHAEDSVRVLGFPGAGGDTITVTQGRVSGFTPDPKIPGRGWIKTDALVTAGNSGGLAANDNGELIGVPTRGPLDQGGLSQIRPINLVKPLLAAAGEPPITVSPYLTIGSGKESLLIARWLDDGIGGLVTVNDYPAGTSRLSAQIGYSGMTDGEDVLTIWQSDSGQVSDLQQSTWSRGSDGDQLIVNLTSQQPFAPGHYMLRILAGPTLQPIGAAATTVGGCLLTGRVLDASTGEGLSAVRLIVLETSTDPAEWSAKPDPRQVISLAESDATGTYRMNHRLPAGQHYPLVVAVAGYYGLQVSILAPPNDLVRDFGLQPATAEPSPA